MKVGVTGRGLFMCAIAVFGMQIGITLHSCLGYRVAEWVVIILEILGISVALFRIAVYRSRRRSERRSKV